MTYYDARRGYGFIRSDEGEKIFFHLSHRGGAYLLEMSGLIGIYPKILVGSTGATSISFHPPVVGSRFYFDAIPSEQGGLRTRLWTFEDDWDNAIEKIRQTQFGVIRTRKVIKDGQWVRAHKVLIRGSCEEIEAAFPSGQVHAELQTIDRPTIKVAISFRVKTDDGWRPCQDPRTNRLHSTLDVMVLRPMAVPR